MTDDITLGDLWQILRARRWLLIGGTILGTALAIVIAFTSKPVYRAEALLAPVSPDQIDGGLAALGGPLGGIASLAGVSLNAGNERKVEALAVLRSRALTEAFVAEANLLPILFPERWDAQKGRWKSSDAKKIPTPWDANELFATKLRKVIEDRDTGLITVAVEWGDPKLAAEWVDELVTRTNDRLRARAIESSRRNMAYLQKQLEVTSIVEVRQSIYRLIENEINNVMVAQGSDEYAFKVIDPAVVPQEKVRPIRAMIIAVGLVSGFALSCVLALFLGEPLRA